MFKKICPKCKTEYETRKKLQECCSTKCANELAIKGWHIGSGGYKLIFLPSHQMATKAGYVPEHRLVMANYLKRVLKDDEVVHHINANKLDNRIENLQIISRYDIGKASKLNVECPACQHKFRAA